MSYRDDDELRRRKRNITFGPTNMQCPDCEQEGRRGSVICRPSRLSDDEYVLECLKCHWKTEIPYEP